MFFYVLWALFTYRDYGMTFDESGVYARGLGLAHYLVHDDYFGFLKKGSPDDGLVIYDHLYAAALSVLNPAADLDYYHWLNMAFALLAFLAAFELLLAQTKKPWLALLGPLFLFLTPRFLGHIPANPKDMPFAVSYLLALAAIYFFSRFPKTPLAAKCVTLGILFGLAQSCRTLGLTLYAVYLLYDLHVFHHGGKRSGSDWGKKLLSTGSLLFLVFAVANLLWVASWPYLGANYVHHLLEALQVSGSFFWQNHVLFLGEQVPAVDLPWTYLPVWILITTPLFILFFAIGSFHFIADKMKNGLFILLLIALGLNLALYLLFQPVLYDGLRHFLFLLPILALLAALSAAEFLERFKLPRLRRFLLALSILGAAATALQMVRLHPYQYVYFNEFTGYLKGAQGKFDDDYWGMSFKEAVDWLKTEGIQDKDRTYKVTGSGNPYQIFYYFPERLKWTDDLKEADYYLSTTRDDKHKLAGNAPVVHIVERDGVPLNYIFKLN